MTTPAFGDDKGRSLYQKFKPAYGFDSSYLRHAQSRGFTREYGAI